VAHRSPSKVVFFLIVLAGVGGLAALSVRTNLPDIRSLQYERTEGVVTLSEVGEKLESGRYAWRLEYTFTVAGREYTGSRFNPGRPRGAKSESSLRQTLRSYPPGRRVIVYYDPADPAEAVLERATLARMLGGLWFLSGPALIVLLIAWGILLGGPAGRFEPPAGGPPWAARLPRTGALLAAAKVGAVVYLAGFAFVCLSGSVARPDRDDGGEQAAAGIAVAAWGVYLAVVAACVWRARVPGLLVIDPAAGTLRYRPRWVWPPPTTVPLAAVHGVEVAERAFEWKGDTAHRYRVRIVYNAAAVDLPEYEDRADADALADWVRGRLVFVPAQGP
jgi:hypothetical protein